MQTLAGIVNNRNFRILLYQAVFLVSVFAACAYLATTTAQNLENRGMASGFDFLKLTAGFDISWSILPYEATDSYGRLFLVAIGNTLVVSIAGIVATTALGFAIGIMRTSKNWLSSTLASGFVEIVRNTPLLLQVLFWYIGVFTLLPPPRIAIDVFELGVIHVTNRGIYVPEPIPGPLFTWTLLAIVVAMVGSYFFFVAAKRRQRRTGKEQTVWPVIIATVVGLPALIFLLTGSPMHFEIPELGRFNFSGGAALPPTFCALFVALAINHAAFVAENVRAGIQAIPAGQYEAARALGLTRKQRLQLVIVPQAKRLIIPPLILTWITLIKNSSLAVMIGYPDLVAVFMQTALNQSGRAIEIVVMVMAFYSIVSLSISAALNYYSKRVALHAS